MKKLFIFSTGLLSMCILNTSQAQTLVTFNYTGSVQTWTVPTCVDSISVDVKGAKGGNMTYNGQTSNGGLGGRVTGKIAVNPGDVLTIYVGGQGGNPNQNSAGYNGGGIGGNNTYCAGGGGASDIRLNGNMLQDRIFVGAGGGGAGTNCWGNGDHGGNGGGITGAPGCQCNSCVGGAPNYPGAGGTQLAGGAAGNDQGQGCTQAGSLGIGGNGACTYGGGGGGGYYGGGGAGYGGGGGGSNYATPNAVAVIHTQGFQSGNGEVIISYTSNVIAGTASVVTSPLCAGDSTEIVLTGSNGTIQWEKSTDGGSTWNTVLGATNDTLVTSALTSTTCYRAEVTCGSSVYSNIVCVTVNPLPTVNFTMQDTVCLNQGTVALTGGTPNGGTYSGNGVSGNVFDPQVAGLGTHVITYNYTDGNGCSNTASFSVVVDECLGLTNFNPLSSIRIFPNPTKGAIQVTLPNGIGQVKAEVVDMQGKVIYTQEQLQVTGGIANLDIQHLSNGIYHINFTAKEYKHAVKVTLQK